MLLTLLVIGCVTDPVTGKPIGEVAYDLPDIAVSPASLDFGVLDLGSSTERTLTVQNVGEASLELTDLTAEDTTWSVVPPSNPVLAPGESVPVTVRWVPTSIGARSASLRVRSTDPDDPSLEVPLSGEAHGPVARVSPDPIDLGSMPVGCDATLTVTVANDGDRDLLVEGLELVGASSEFDFEAPTLPLVLTSGQSVEASIGYLPADHATDGGSLVVTSSDPVEPDRSVLVSGTGVVGEVATESFEQGAATELDLVIVPSALAEPARDAAVDLLEAWLDALDVGGADYRMIVLSTYGCNSTADPWLDAELDGADRTDTLELAIERAAVESAYESAGLQRLHWALQDEGDGYYADCDAGFFRDDARLVVLGITDGPDHSTLVSWIDVAERIEDFRGAGQRLVHAVAPEDPGGCDLYEAGSGWSDLVAEEGGSFFSYCATDWSAHGEALGALDPGRRTRWVLAQPAVGHTVEVEVAGTPALTGWHYDEADNAVVFDDVPEAGDRVELSYAVRPDSCD